MTQTVYLKLSQITQDHSVVGELLRNQVITPEMAARVICAEGLCDIVYVNQVDDPEVSPPWAEAFVRASSVPVVAGSLQARRWRRLS
jgi:hypothetical protein